jgi:phytoene dehydrogenase-like protein
MPIDVAIVGAGLSGLACARECAELGLDFLLLERAERVGGRVVTDAEDGFLLDRGFQVLLSSYPEVQRLAPVERLGAGRFRPGALVRFRGAFHRVVDPWRSPLEGLAAIATPFVSLGDGLRLSQLREECLAGRHEGDLRPTHALLRDFGFGEGVLEAFLRPFFGGVTLDRSLSVPAWYFARLFGWFARGDATLPMAGMGALPRALATSLEPARLRLGATVEVVEPRAVVLATGERIECGRVVLATDAAATQALLGDGEPREWSGTTTLYFDAPASPVGDPILVLNGEGPGDGPVNHLCVLSDAQPAYAPPGRSLVSVSVLGVPEAPDPELVEDARHQLEGWYGPSVRDWRLLRVDRIPRALPRLEGAEVLCSEHGGVLLCGDQVASPSIQGSLASGRASARAAAGVGA